MPLNNCNDAQRAAVKHVSGPMLLLAGPGSGKTFTIIERIRYLIETQGIEQTQILVITFTKAAAGEMEQRFQKAVEGKNYNVNFGTFHAIYFQILKQTYQYQSQHILNEKEKREYLYFVLKERGVEADGELTEHLLNEFGKVKNSALGILGYIYTGSAMEKEKFEEIYISYREYCRENKKLDFDDMALLVLDLFRKKKEVLALWQKRFRFFLVDEFQDINPAQYEVLRMLVGEEGNVFVVGDDDQSIYGFRGANPSIMQKFLTDFPKAKKCCLTSNYRSGKKIVDFSQKIIEQNKNRMEKKIKAEAKDCGEITIRGYKKSEEQFAGLLENLKEEEREGRLDLCAVIFRTNAEAVKLKELLQKEKLPFVMEKKRKENPLPHPVWSDIKDMVIFAGGEHRRSILLRIMNKPSRYIGRNCMPNEKVDFADMKSYYRDNHQVRGNIEELEHHLEVLCTLSPFLAVTYIRKAMKYDNYLTKMGAEYREAADKIQKAASQYNNITEWIQTYEINAGQEQKQTEEETGREGKLTVITMHAAKGLEYDTVFLPNITEGVVPYGKMLTAEAIEEERRIFYVAVTRAKKRLIISYIEDEKRVPSRFLALKKTRLV